MSKTAMLVENTELHRKLFTVWLEISGYTVHPIADERIAVTEAVRLQPKLAVVDILMPNIDGREVIRALRRNPQTSHIGILALSVLSEAEDEESCYLAGADAFQHKIKGRASFAECLAKFG